MTVDETQRTFAVTTSLATAPILRNVFIIERPNEADMDPYDKTSEVLHYNQNFVLRAHPNYTTDPYYLSSTIVSPYCASRVSHEQLVFLTDIKSYKCCWKLQHREPLRRPEVDGEPIRPDQGDEDSRETFVLTHSHTGFNLASDKKLYMYARK